VALALSFASLLQGSLPCEDPMPFSIRSFRRFPVQYSVTYHAGPFEGQGTIWNLSCSGW